MSNHYHIESIPVHWCTRLWLSPGLTTLLLIPGLQPQSAPQQHAPATPAADIAATQVSASLVYPLLAIANSRWFYFSSAARQGGMVYLFPDTAIDGKWCTDYRYHKKTIKGFNHIHEWQSAGFSLVSDVRPLDAQKTNYASAFSHRGEQINLGLHQVYLQRSGIQAGLTTTDRVGFAQYQYQAQMSQQLLLQLSGVQGPSWLGYAEVWQIDDFALAGFITNQGSERKVRPVRVCFHRQFSAAIIRGDGWGGEQMFQNINGISGDDAGLRLSFASSNTQLPVKTPISYVLTADAQLNLQQELPSWDCEAVRLQAFNSWNDLLNHNRIKGESKQLRRRFYTDLWYGLQGRRQVSDVNDQSMYLSGAELRIRHLATRTSTMLPAAIYNSDSVCRAQWTITTLWSLAYPEYANAFTKGQRQYDRDFGLIRRGPAGRQDTLVMPRVPMMPFLLSLAQKGLLQTPVSELLPMQLKTHQPGGLTTKACYEHYSATGGGLKDYQNRGYVPYPLPETASNYGSDRRGAGQTLEHAYQDHLLPRQALKTAQPQIAAQYLQHNPNWRQLFDAGTSVIRPIDGNRQWRTLFAPYEYDVGFIESNAAQASWFVPHDIRGLTAARGDNSQLFSKLQQAFIIAKRQGVTAGASHAPEGHLEYRPIPTSYDEQSNIQTALILAELDEPAKTLHGSRQNVNSVYYHLSPERGYNGDEDQVLMGSLAVLLKLELFQLNGGLETAPVYQLSNQLFDEAFFDVAADRESCIHALNNGLTRPDIQAVTLYSKPLQLGTLRHRDIMVGGTLQLTMSNLPKSQQL